MSQQAAPQPAPEAAKPMVEIEGQQELGRSVHATTAENMEAAVAHWAGGLPPKPVPYAVNSAGTSSIGDITPGGGATPGSTTPRRYDSAQRLAGGASLDFTARPSEGNPSLQIVSTGAKWEDVVGYSRAVQRGPFMFVSGTASVDQATGHVMYPEDAYRQTRQALTIIDHALHALGASLKDVVRTRMFVADLARDSPAISKAHGEVFGTIRPASTMVEVAKLYSHVLVTIEADAIADVEF